MKYNLFILLILINFSINGQDSIRTYKIESKSYEIEKKYAIQEIIISSDSTYSHLNYRLDNKSQRKEYRTFKAEETKGKFRKAGDYYLFRPFNQTFEFGKYKITEKYITYYYPWKKNKFRRGAKFKRIEKL